MDRWRPGSPFIRTRIVRGSLWNSSKAGSTLTARSFNAEERRVVTAESWWLAWVALSYSRSLHRCHCSGCDPDPTHIQKRLDTKVRGWSGGGPRRNATKSSMLSRNKEAKSITQSKGNMATVIHQLLEKTLFRFIDRSNVGSAIHWMGYIQNLTLVETGAQLDQGSCCPMLELSKQSMKKTCARLAMMQSVGPELDYGNNIRAMAFDAGTKKCLWFQDLCLLIFDPLIL